METDLAAGAGFGGSGLGGVLYNGWCCTMWYSFSIELHGRRAWRWWEINGFTFFEFTSTDCTEYEVNFWIHIFNQVKSKGSLQVVFHCIIVTTP